MAAFAATAGWVASGWRLDPPGLSGAEAADRPVAARYAGGIFLGFAALRMDSDRSRPSNGIHILKTVVYDGCVMSTRVQVVMDEIEREAFRRAAAREGLSLSDWLRRAARQRLQAAARTGPGSLEELRVFFEDCRQREQGDEPGWQQHRAVIEESKASGRSTT